jgi:hypothetical protein
LFLRRIHRYMSFHFFPFIRRFPGSSSLHIFHPFPFLLFANSLSYSKVFFHPSSSASPHSQFILIPPGHRYVFFIHSLPSASVHIFVSPDRLSWFFPIPSFFL